MMATTINNIEASKKSWTSTHPDGTVYPGDDKIKIACLQRIASATEVMSQNYVHLQNECERYRKWWLNEQEERQELERRYSAMKGVVTKLKNKLKELNK